MRPALVLALDDGQVPRIDPTAFVAPGAVVTGDVVLGPGANLWFGVIARGDQEPIVLGAGVNVQDGCILHTDPGLGLTIAPGVAVGHGAIVHGCEIAEDVLIGMGAIVLSGARVGAGSIVAAGALVREGQHIPERSLVAGIPARIVREGVESPAPRVCATYAERARRYRSVLDGRERTDRLAVRGTSVTQE